MAVRDIRLWPDPVLTQTCAHIALDDPDLPTLVDDLFETMYAAKGRGLAAPQIGVLHRVFVVDVSWKEGAPDPRVFINPTVRETSEDSGTMDEQCLSIPDLPMPVGRPEHVQLCWHGRCGTAHEATFEGVLGRCIQHEFDLLNGVVVFDHQPSDIRTALEARYGA